MNNHPKITIDLVLDRHTTKEVLHAVLHSILFHRLFGTVKPQIFDVLDVSMPGVNDEGMKQLVHSKVEAFWKSIEGGVNKRGQIIVTFSEKRTQKRWFSTGEVCHLTNAGSISELTSPRFLGRSALEQWIVNAEIRQPTTDRERQKFNADLAAALTQSLETMLTYTSSEQGRAAVPS
ncbi:Meiotically up-regulated gene 66 protein [Grifola frondosa]|uniref:Autophagy-related protein 101 n=1 Tax=Grifola frondosa TaxID=5627 RepID=A0A1C7LKB1_GRIFR|nr:Meiotically up-regulated gene 66 protein [Grifola frondosa]